MFVWMVRRLLVPFGGSETAPPSGTSGKRIGVPARFPTNPMYPPVPRTLFNTNGEAIPTSTTAEETT